MPQEVLKFSLQLDSVAATPQFEALSAKVCDKTSKSNDEVALLSQRWFSIKLCKGLKELVPVQLAILYLPYSIIYLTSSADFVYCCYMKHMLDFVLT